MLGGHVYRYFNLPYMSPTIGLYFYGDEYVNFLSNLKHYCECKPEFIKAKDSRHYGQIVEQGNTHALIGILGGEVEVVFLHYATREEAIQKWQRRTERMNWSNVIIKFSEQNWATPEQLRYVDSLSYERKIIFTSHDYKLKSQVIFKEWEGFSQIPDETTHFRRYVNLVNLVNGKPFKKRFFRKTDFPVSFFHSS